MRTLIIGILVAIGIAIFVAYYAYKIYETEHQINYTPVAKSGDPSKSKNVCIFGTYPKCSEAGMITSPTGCCTHPLPTSLKKSEIDMILNMAASIGEAVIDMELMQMAVKAVTKGAEYVVRIVATTAAEDISETLLIAATADSLLADIPVVGEILLALLDAAMFVGMAVDLIFSHAAINKVEYRSTMIQSKKLLKDSFETGLQQYADSHGQKISYPVPTGPIDGGDANYHKNVKHILGGKMAQIATDLLNSPEGERYRGKSNEFIQRISDDTTAFFKTPAGQVYILSRLCRFYNGFFRSGVCTYSKGQCEKYNSKGLIGMYDDSKQVCYISPYGKLKSVCAKDGASWDFDSQTCIIDEAYCHKKGLSWDDTKKDCYEPSAEKFFENIFGKIITKEVVAGVNELGDYIGKTAKKLGDWAGDGHKISVKNLVHISNKLGGADHRTIVVKTFTSTLSGSNVNAAKTLFEVIYDVSDVTTSKKHIAHDITTSYRGVVKNSKAGSDVIKGLESLGSKIAAYYGWPK